MFNECSTAKRTAERQLQQQTEQWEKQLAESKNLYGLNSQLAQQVESAQAEKKHELAKLSNECQVLNARSETLSTAITKLRQHIAETESEHLRLLEEIAQLTLQLEESRARLVEQQEECARMEREREEREAKHSADMAKTAGERDDKARTVLHFERTMMPRVFRASKWMWCANWP